VPRSTLVKVVKRKNKA